MSVQIKLAPPLPEEMSERLEELKQSFRNEPILVTPIVFGFTLESLEFGRAVLTMKVTEGMLVGGKGIVNGGIMDTLGNTASVYAAMSMVPFGHMPRMNFTVTNLRKAFGGETLKAIAEGIADIGSSVVVNFRIFREDHPEDLKVVGRGQYHKPKE